MGGRLRLWIMLRYWGGSEGSGLLGWKTRSHECEHCTHECVRHVCIKGRGASGGGNQVAGSENAYL